MRKIQRKHCTGIPPYKQFPQSSALMDIDVTAKYLLSICYPRNRYIELLARDREQFTYLELLLRYFLYADEVFLFPPMQLSIQECKIFYTQKQPQLYTFPHPTYKTMGGIADYFAALDIDYAVLKENAEEMPDIELFSQSINENSESEQETEDKDNYPNVRDVDQIWHLPGQKDVKPTSMYDDPITAVENESTEPSDYPPTKKRSIIYNFLTRTFRKIQTSTYYDIMQ